MRRIELGPRPTSRGDLAKWYSEALASLAASGLTVAEFAERAGVTEATIYRWRQLFRTREATEALPAKLIEVTATPPSSLATEPSSSGPLVVRLCSGRRSIDVPAAFDSDELRRLLSVLESC
jgi:transposase-like protein